MIGPGRHPGTTEGEGGETATHTTSSTTESPSAKGGETERPQKRHEPTKAHNQAKGDNYRKTKRNQPKQQNKGQPKGRGWTATMRRQSGGGAEKGHAIRTHRATWPMRAEISDTQGTHSLGHNIKLTTKGGETRARKSKGRKGRGEGIATSYFVQCIRGNGVCPIEGSHSNYCQSRRKQDAALPALRHEDAARCTCPERLPDHHQASVFVASDWEIRVFVHVA